MGTNGGVKPIGCHDKFHHTMKIGSARIACLCLKCACPSLTLFSHGSSAPLCEASSSSSRSLQTCITMEGMVSS